jgi:hypothetical protein
MAEDSAEALLWFRERLAWLAKRFPELTTPEHRVRLAAELERQEDEENGHGKDLDR